MPAEGKLIRTERINEDYNEIWKIPSDVAIDNICCLCCRTFPDSCQHDIVLVKHYSDYPYPIIWEFCNEDCWEIFKTKIYNGGAECEAAAEATAP